MKKIYSFKKEVLFDNNIYDILSIAIDKKFSIDGYAIKGKFRINGEYLVKENEKEEFDFDIPYLNYIEDDYDVSKIKIDIDDFYYEIKDSCKLVINIDICVDGLELIERCIDDTASKNDEYDVEVNDEEITEIKNEIMEENVDKIRDDNMNNIIEDNVEENIIEQKITEANYFNPSSNDSYSTYKICIVRENDTIESIIEKYNVTLDKIKEYNVINDIKIGDKIIIPYEGN